MAKKSYNNKKDLTATFKEMVSTMILEENGEPVVPSTDLAVLKKQIISAGKWVQPDDEFTETTANVIEWAMECDKKKVQIVPNTREEYIPDDDADDANEEDQDVGGEEEADEAEDENVEDAVENVDDVNEKDVEELVPQKVLKSSKPSKIKTPKAPKPQFITNTYSRSSALGEAIVAHNNKTLELTQIAQFADNLFMEKTKKGANIKESTGRLRSIIDCLESMKVISREGTNISIHF